MDITRVTRYFKLSEGYGYWDELTDWCVAEFGYPGPGDDAKWDYITHIISMDFYFRDPRDAEYFILKWM
jgi:hypothetical protein